MKIITYIDIELALVRFFNMHKNLIVPNYYISPSHECDLIVVTGAGYATEIEIKMSVADMRADLRKKHKHINDKLKLLYYAFSDEIYDKCKDMLPPDAGVLVISPHPENHFWVEKIKTPKEKKCRKLTDKEMLHIARTATLKLWNAKDTIQENLIYIKKLKENKK